MIRHSNSLFISILIHIGILTALFFLYTEVFSKPEPKKEDHKLCLKLCNIKEKTIEPAPKKPMPKKPPEVKPPPKKVEKPKPKKEKPKPKVEKKEIKKKVVAKKKVKIIKDEIIEEKVIVLEKPKPLPPQIEIIPEVVEIVDAVPTETPEAKNRRLEKDYLAENIIKIRELIADNLYYPRSARKRGIIGEVIVKFTISTDAEVHSIDIVSSKSEILSRAALKTIKNIASEFPKPNETLVLHVPISYKLD